MLLDCMSKVTHSQQKKRPSRVKQVREGIFELNAVFELMLAMVKSAYVGFVMP